MNWDDMTCLSTSSKIDKGGLGQNAADDGQDDFEM